MAHKNSFAHQSKLQIYGKHKLNRTHSGKGNEIIIIIISSVITTINIYSGIFFITFRHFIWSVQRTAIWIFHDHFVNVLLIEEANNQNQWNVEKKIWNETNANDESNGNTAA